MDDEGQMLPEPSAAYSRAEVAYMMMRRGVTLSDVAAELRVTPSAVQQMINQRYQTEARDQTPETRQALLAMENDRLEYYLSKLWPEIECGDPKSITAALAVHDRKMKVNRLDLPDASTGQSSVLVISGVESNYIKQLQELTDGD